jgi:hypothetical protein
VCLGCTCIYLCVHIPEGILAHACILHRKVFALKILLLILRQEKVLATVEAPAKRCARLDAQRFPKASPTGTLLPNNLVHRHPSFSGVVAN